MEAGAHPTWTDPRTGLMWARRDSDTVNWWQAVDYCRKSALADYRDWRLAEIDELQGIGDKTLAPNRMHIKGGIQVRGWTWSNTPSKVRRTAWVFNFYANYATPNVYFNFQHERALCVRGSGR